MGDKSQLSQLSEVSIGEELNLFIDYIDSLADTLPPTLSAIGKVQSAALKDFLRLNTNYVDPKSIKMKITEDKQLAISTPFTPRRELQRVIDNLQKSAFADKLILRSFVISLVSQYDAFLGRLIRALFLIQPESLNISEKNITFVQLQSFGSIEDAKEYIIEKEIETILRKSHAEQFDWLEKKFDIKLHEGLQIWPVFIEVTERRNLFVHNSGIVTNQYMNVCTAHKIELKDIHIGEQLEATPEYFETAYRCIFEIGVKLAHVLWRKVYQADRARADQNLDRICYKLLSEERLTLACVLLNFATDLKKYSSEKLKRRLIINKALAYKWSGDSQKAKSIINNEDWSATSDDLKLAEAVILDDFEKADNLVKKIGPDGDVNKGYYRDWPLFKEYRNTPGFLRTYEEVFGEPFYQTDEEEKKRQNQYQSILKVVGDVSKEHREFTKNELEQIQSNPSLVYSALIDHFSDKLAIDSIKFSKELKDDSSDDLSEPTQET